MKKLYLHIVLILLLIASEGAFGQYALDNNGKISNKGTIRVKSGQVRGLPDTLNGRIEFLQNRFSSQQSIPNIVYEQLVIKNRAKKIVSDAYKNPDGTVRPLITLDSLIISDSGYFTTRWIGTNPENIEARASVLNKADYTGPKYIKLNNEVKEQDLIGNGKFSKLEIDNPNGVNVKEGGARVDSLRLTRGTLRNSRENNIKMTDSSLIERQVGATIAAAPEFEGKSSIRYHGEGSLLTGNEMPIDSTSLLALSVETSAGIVLNHDVTVANELFIGSSIETEPDSLKRYALTYLGEKNPQFGNSEAEIKGTMRRKNVAVRDTVVFNNPYTFVYFQNELNKNGTHSISFRVRPSAFSPLPLGDANKVKRHFSIQSYDKSYNLIKSDVVARVGYGWRFSPDQAERDETLLLPLEQLVLQRYLDNTWNEVHSSQIADSRESVGWAFSYADDVTLYGDFSIGMPGGAHLLMAARVFMEGPWRNGSMAADLLSRNLIPTTPPDVYPYNLDPKREKISVVSIPDSVVDWIVLEFRTQLIGGRQYYKTCFLKQDGTISDINGFNDINLNSVGMPRGNYYIAVRHRNHLSVMTSNPFVVFPVNDPEVLDFTSPEILLGKTNALKALQKRENNSIIYGMIAGDVNADGIIDEDDFLSIWDYRDFMGYIRPEDIRLNGIITTRDYNVSWNNRGRITLVP